VTTWILLPFNAEWRWLQDRDDSPWYPSVQLWRQRRAGDWPGLIADVVDALTAPGPIPMHESLKAMKRRQRDPLFTSRYFVGRGIDIGSGPDPLRPPEAVRRLAADGELRRVGRRGRRRAADGGRPRRRRSISSTRRTRSSTCRPGRDALELVADPEAGGHLVVAVPDEDLYEQGVWPPTFNTDHKHTYALAKRESWSPVSRNIDELLKGSAARSSSSSASRKASSSACRSASIRRRRRSPSPASSASCGSRPHRKSGRHVLFPMPEARVWYHKHLEAKGAKSAAPTDRSNSVDRRLAVEAEMAEIDLAKKRNELMKVDDFDRILSDAFGRVRARLINLAPRIAGIVLGATSIQDAQARIEPLVREAMEELRRADDVPTSDDDDEDATP
jgi:hypothetical protein